LAKPESRGIKTRINLQRRRKCNYGGKKEMGKMTMRKRKIVLFAPIKFVPLVEVAKHMSMVN
jgi:hypothetical protein